MTRLLRIGLLGMIAVMMVFGVAAGPAAAQPQVPQSHEQIQLSFAPLVKRAAPAVVNIFTRTVVSSRQVNPLFDDPFFRRFFGDGFGFEKPRDRVQNSLGSGVIVNENGLIVTNGHVIEGADEVTVVLSDQREFDAEVVEVDERTDLAVLRIDTKGESLPYLELRDSDEVEVGDLVLAIGNPFGVGQTVTSGIVSAVARTQVGLSDLNFFIQTDAAINPGNSGGALITMDGKLVGVNTAIFSKTGGSHGIGFAVPSNMVRFVLAGVAKGGVLVRPWLGAWGQTVTSELAESLRRPKPGGVLVNRIYPHGPAEKAGIKKGDIILAINGRSVPDPQALRFRIGTLTVGGKADLTVWRRGGERRLSIALLAPPEDPPRNITRLEGRHPLSGAVVANMSPALADELGLHAFNPGVYIFSLQRRSIANRLGFRPGDRILAINGEDIDRVSTLQGAIDRATGDWEMRVERGGKTFNLAFDR